MTKSAKELGIAMVDAEDRRDADGLVALCSEDFQWHLPSETRNRNQLHEAAKALFASHPDRRATVQDAFEQGDRSVVRYTTARHSESDGSEIKQSIIEIYRVADDKVVEVWSIIASVE